MLFRKLDADLSFPVIFLVLSTLPYFHSPAPPTPPGFLRHVRNRKCVLMGPACVGHYFKMRQAGPLSRNLCLNSSKILSNKLGNFNSVYCTIYKIVHDPDFRVSVPWFSCKYISD